MTGYGRAEKYLNYKYEIIGGKSRSAIEIAPTRDAEK